MDTVDTSADPSSRTSPPLSEGNPSPLSPPTIIYLKPPEVPLTILSTISPIICPFLPLEYPTTPPALGETAPTIDPSSRTSPPLSEGNPLPLSPLTIVHSKPPEVPPTTLSTISPIISPILPLENPTTPLALGETVPTIEIPLSHCSAIPLYSTFFFSLVISPKASSASYSSDHPSTEILSSLLDNPSILMEDITGSNEATSVPGKFGEEVPSALLTSSSLSLRDLRILHQEEL